MNDTADSATAMSRTDDPVDQVMSMIMSVQGLPDPADLARGFLAVWSDLPGVRAAAVALDPEVTVLLDGAACRPGESWLVTTRDRSGGAADPRWVEMAGSWPTLLAVWGRSRGTSCECISGPHPQVLAGNGALPGGEPWSAPGDGPDPVTCSGWLMAPVEVRGLVRFAVVLGLDDSPENLPEIREHLDRLVKTLLPVVAVWSDALGLARRLRRADDENRALARLNRLQGRFVALASHELKAPLTSITAYTDVLGKQLTATDFPQAGEFLKVIRNESGRLLRMVNRILDFTRMEHGARLLSLKPVAMEPLVRDTIHSLGPGISDKHLIVDVEAPVGLPRAAVDPDLIRQVLVNLMHNAVKFTPTGGRIIVRLQEKESAVAVSVMDDGPGIPPEDIRRIFREFYRAEGGTSGEEGAGLGLTIARHIVNLHGGHIEVARRPGGGSDFRFLVPKEMGALAPLAEVLRVPVDEEEGARLVEHLLFLLAEMTGSRTVVMLLRDGGGALVPVGALGLDLESTKPLPLIENKGWTRFLERGEPKTDPGTLVGEIGWCPHEDCTQGTRMYAPIGSGEEAQGLIILGRRRGLETYNQADLTQIGVLSGIVQAALGHLEGNMVRTTAAVRLLLRIRRNGVPTATPVALAMTEKLGDRLGLDKQAIKRLQLAAVLHDAGMAQVEDEIVLGESELSLDERDEVDRHVEQVVDLVGPLLPDKNIELTIRHHHERFDGSGYPDGLAGEAIPLGSRLMAVIDTWFSLTSPRPFRSGLSPQEAHAEVLDHVGTQLDGRIVAEFTKLLQSEGVLEGSPAAAGPPGSGF